MTLNRVDSVPIRFPNCGASEHRLRRIKCLAVDTTCLNNSESRLGRISSQATNANWVPSIVDEGRLADSHTDGIELLVSVATRQSYCGTVPTLDLRRVWEESRAVYSRFVHARFERALQAISGLGPVDTTGDR